MNARTIIDEMAAKWHDFRHRKERREAELKALEEAIQARSECECRRHQENVERLLSRLNGVSEIPTAIASMTRQLIPLQESLNEHLTEANADLGMRLEAWAKTSDENRSSLQRLKEWKNTETTHILDIKHRLDDIEKALPAIVSLDDLVGKVAHLDKNLPRLDKMEADLAALRRRIDKESLVAKDILVRLDAIDEAIRELREGRSQSEPAPKDGNPVQPDLPNIADAEKDAESSGTHGNGPRGDSNRPDRPSPPSDGATPEPPSVAVRFADLVTTPDGEDGIRLLNTYRYAHRKVRDIMRRQHNRHIGLTPFLKAVGAWTDFQRKSLSAAESRQADRIRTFVAERIRALDPEGGIWGTSVANPMKIVAAFNERHWFRDPRENR